MQRAGARWRRPLMMEATAGFEPAIEVLQTSALPLGYVALTFGILADS